MFNLRNSGMPFSYQFQRRRRLDVAVFAMPQPQLSSSKVAVQPSVLCLRALATLAISGTSVLLSL